MSFFSKSCLYGILSCSYLAGHGRGGFVPVSEIARNFDISHHYLAKVLQQMNQKGIINSTRGAKGGVTLARKAADISIYDIICAFEQQSDIISARQVFGNKKSDKLPVELSYLYGKFKDICVDASLEVFVNMIAK